MRSIAPRTAQRGTSLVEALVAFLVLALGMVALARHQGTLRLDVDLARQRTDASRLAQQEMEAVRGTRPFAAITSTSRGVDADVHYLVTREITALTPLQAKAASITVKWSDRGGTARQVALHSIVDGTDPALTGALALAPPPAASAPASGSTPR